MPEFKTKEEYDAWKSQRIKDAKNNAKGHGKKSIITTSCLRSKSNNYVKVIKIVSAIVILLALCVVIFYDDNKYSVPLPSYDVVDRTVYDVPLKTELVINAVVSGAITEPGLKTLLYRLYKDADDMRGFKYHNGRPTHIFVYLYTSIAHFKSGFGHWIAKLSKIGDGSPINIAIQTDIIKHLNEIPETKYGLTELKRKEIYAAIINTEDSAYADAQNRYPLPDPLSTNYSEARAKEQFRMQDETWHSSIEGCRLKIAKQFGLTLEQVIEIGAEGVTKDWAVPSGKP